MLNQPIDNDPVTWPDEKKDHGEDLTQAVPMQSKSVARMSQSLQAQTLGTMVL